MSNINNLNSVQNNPYINANSADYIAGFNAGVASASGTNSGTSNAANTGTSSTSNATNNTTNAISSFFSTGNTQQDFLKGALIGAVATFVLTNKDTQRAIFKGFAKLSALFEMGIEEMKERYEDAKAEAQSE